jgi:hypothetical protein
MALAGQADEFGGLLIVVRVKKMDIAALQAAYQGG